MTPLLELPSGGVLDFSGPPLVMAIVNCNDDSFFAPSRARAGAAVERALRAVESGASIVDFGGESSRPGATYVSVEEELERVLPVVEAFRRRSSAPISVDTRKAAVARSALDAGADIVNDISALEDDDALAQLCAERGAAVVLMHKKGNPEHMQDAPLYGDVVAEVGAYLRSAAERAFAAGIGRSKIILDPGFGFGKRLEDNLDLLASLAELTGGGYPVLVGLSRKSFIGTLTGKDSGGRLAGSLAAAAAAVAAGAKILRVHDSDETADLVKVLHAVASRRGSRSN